MSQFNLRLQVIIGVSDLYRFSTGAPELRHETNNKRLNRIRSSPEYDSHILLPLIKQRGTA